MSTTVRTRRPIVVFLAMAALMFALLPVAPASAGQAKIALTGIATLNAGISAPCSSNTHSGSFTGTAVGVHGTAPGAPVNVNASFLYCNADTVVGTAQGSITFSGGGIPTHACSFTWNRTGVVAVVTISGCDSPGTAVAEFIPITPPGAVPGQAAVVGQGVL